MTSYGVAVVPSFHLVHILVGSKRWGDACASKGMSMILLGKE